jgi:hypothetical protein
VSGTRCTCGAGHLTFGACLRAKNIQIGDLKAHDVNKRGETDLAAYKAARDQGIQPSGIQRSAVDRAVRISEAEGKAFDANSPVTGFGALGG